MADISFQFSTVRATMRSVAHSLQEKIAARRLLFGKGFTDRAASRVAHALPHSKVSHQSHGS